MVERNSHAHACGIIRAVDYIYVCAHYSARTRSFTLKDEAAAMEMCTIQRIGAAPRMPLQTLISRRGNLLLRRTKNTRNNNKPCKAAGVDRRDVILGLGGAAAAGLAFRDGGGALAEPIQAPDIQDCDPPATAPDDSCCPRYLPGTDIVDFSPPPASSPLRVRPAAHLVDDEYVAKYEKAVALMKALPDDDPRSFEQQWRVHCAYCDGVYDQVGVPDLELQIHHCWLFFPWHR